MDVDPNIEQISFMTGTTLHLGLCPCTQMLKVEKMSKKSLESHQKLLMFPPRVENGPLQDTDLVEMP